MTAPDPAVRDRLAIALDVPDLDAARTLAVHGLQLHGSIQFIHYSWEGKLYLTVEYRQGDQAQGGAVGQEVLVDLVAVPDLLDPPHLPSLSRPIPKFGNVSKRRSQMALRLRNSPVRCVASEGDSVRGSPCGEPVRLRFTSLRPPPAATPPDTLRHRRHRPRRGFSMEVVRQGGVTLRCRRFRGTYLV